jgi:hypothetical protein
VYFAFAAIVSDRINIGRRQDFIKFEGCEFDGIEIGWFKWTMMNDFWELSSL